MTQLKRRPIRAPDGLMTADDVAEMLLVSRTAIYRLVARRRLPFYRLLGGLRFKRAEIDAFLESRRIEARVTKKHGGS